MKKLLLSILLLFVVGYSNAQTWQSLNGNIYFNSGYVGIGTYNPNNTLDVNGGITANNISNINGITFNTSNTYYRELQAPGYNLNIRSGDGSSVLAIPYTNNAYPRFQNFGLLVDNNLGVGVANPNEKISADGNIVIQSSNSNSRGFMFSSPASNWGTQISGLYFSPRDNVNSTIDFKVSLWDGLSRNYDRLFINGLNGNIGIGTIQPDKPLTVNGTIHATEVLIDQTVDKTPDYVFDKDYDLASLKDVKTYIDQNHHLPEIPSAAQVAKDGINLGQMNAKLLKKIEELTLYLIEKDAQIDKQELQNISQQQQIDQMKIQIKELLTKASEK